MTDHTDHTDRPDDPASPSPASQIVELAPVATPEITRTRPGRRGVLIAAGLVAVLAVVAGVLFATRGDDAGVEDLLARAASATEASGTARVEMTVRMPVAGREPTPLTTIGEVDFDQRVVHAVMDLSASGLGGSGSPASGNVEMVSSGLVVHMRGAVFGPELAGKWVKFDYAVLFEAQGLDPAALTAQRGNDPASMLQVLRSAGEVVTIGAEDVRGVSTTHHRSTVDPTAMFASAGAVQDEAKVAALAALYTGPIQIDVWVGSDGLVHRYAMAAPMAAGTLSYDYVFYDFGVAVDARLPAAADVVDLTSMLAGNK